MMRVWRINFSWIFRTETYLFLCIFPSFFSNIKKISAAKSSDIFFGGEDGWENTFPPFAVRGCVDEKLRFIENKEKRRNFSLFSSKSEDNWKIIIWTLDFSFSLLFSRFFHLESFLGKMVRNFQTITRINTSHPSGVAFAYQLKLVGRENNQFARRIFNVFVEKTFLNKLFFT